VTPQVRPHTNDGRSATTPPADAPAEEPTPTIRGSLKSFGALFAPATLVGALLLYVGWIRTRAFFNYFGSTEAERHVRFSVWNESGSAEAAVSLDEKEAQRLARFILASGPPRPARPSLLETVLGLAGGGRRR